MTLHNFKLLSKDVHLAYVYNQGTYLARRWDDFNQAVNPYQVPGSLFVEVNYNVSQNEVTHLFLFEAGGEEDWLAESSLNLSRSPIYFFMIFSIPTSPHRIYGLDVLRAFAILTVMAGHASVLIGSNLLPYYSLFYQDGVSIFFVLSGFLIGGILIKTLEERPATPRVLLDFWLKRWFRTVPPYFLALTVVIVLSARTPGFRFPDLKEYYLFVQNFNWPHPGFFDEAWSLSIEEWFYLFVPSAVFGLAALRLRPKTAVLVTALALLLVVTFYRGYKFLHLPPHSVQEWDLQFRKIVITRLDALMYGVLAAYAAHYFPAHWRKHKTILLVLGLGALLVHRFLQMPPDSLYSCVFSFSLVALGTALLLPFLSEWRTSAGLFSRAVTHISLISYSLYLIHSSLLLWIVIMPHLNLFPGSSTIQHLLIIATYWALCVGLATLMYKYFELPFIRLRSRFNVLPAKSNQVVRVS